MTHDILFFVAGALAIVGQGLDDITTNAGLATGGKELNSFVAWAIKHLGFPVVAFIKVGGLAIGLPVLFYQLGHPVAGAVVALMSATAGFYAGIVNYIALHKAKISVF
jgi:Domain of unknown function (DUF5658)